MSSRLFFALGPRLARVDQPSPPAHLAPWTTIAIPRSQRPGKLTATWYPTTVAAPRGAVLFLHPWMEWGKAYFHRRGRIEAVRSAGHHVLTVDLPGFGGSGPRRGLLDIDVADAVAALAARCPGLPLAIWGVSSGGYWAHPVLARGDRVRTAFFEDVSPHLIEWSRRMTPWGRPAFRFFQLAFRRSYRFLDLRRHAPHAGLRAVAYVSGATDRGVQPTETEALARLGGGPALIVPEAGHLGAIRRAGPQIIDLALATFERGL